MELAGMISGLGMAPFGQIALGGAFALDLMLLAGLSLSLVGIGRSIHADRSVRATEAPRRFAATAARAHLIALPTSR